MPAAPKTKAQLVHELAVLRWEDDALKAAVARQQQTEAALAQQEEYFRALIENASDVMTVMDGEGRFRYQSPVAERLLGHRLADAGLRAGFPFVHPDDKAKTEAAFAEVLHKPGGKVQTELRMQHQDGSWRTIEARGLNLLSNPAIAGIVVNIRDITEQKQAEAALQRSHAQLRQLSARLQTVREEEQQRLARDLHDELGQTLTALLLDLLFVMDQLAPQAPELHEKFQAMVHHIQTMIDTVRRIMTELRPSMLDDLGLVATLKGQAQDFHARTGIICQVTTRGEMPALGAAQATALFRISQEALTNVLRHARATVVTVSLTVQDNRVQLAVQDNGRGITAHDLEDGPALGLLGMRERAALLGGDVTLQATPGHGTTVVADIPLEA